MFLYIICETSQVLVLKICRSIEQKQGISSHTVAFRMKTLAETRKKISETQEAGVQLMTEMQMKAGSEVEARIQEYP